MAGPTVGASALPGKLESSAMITFEVKDMTCNHCVGAITKAVQAVDGNAKIEIDLDRHLVKVEPTAIDAARLRSVITEAGYTPVPVGTAQS